MGLAVYENRDQIKKKKKKIGIKCSNYYVTVIVFIMS